VLETELDQRALPPAPTLPAGLGRALLARALWAVLERQVPLVRLSTVAESPTLARDLYESVGFRVVAELPRCRKTPAEPRVWPGAVGEMKRCQRTISG